MKELNFWVVKDGGGVYRTACSPNVQFQLWDYELGMSGDEETEDDSGQGRDD